MRSGRFTKVLGSVASTCAFIAVAANSSSAQEDVVPRLSVDTSEETAREELAQAPEEFAQANVIRLDEIEVTARRRVEDIQDVPISITTVTEADIVENDLEDFDDFIEITPGFNALLSPNSFTSSFNVRGVGSVVPGGFEDGSVSAYVDGVPVPLSQLDTYYLDIQQVEVLRGPQGTLYGKTAQAGAVNITTIGPSDVFEASLTGTIATNDTYGITGVVSGPIVDGRLNGRLLMNAETEDSFIRVVNEDDRSLGHDRRLVVRGTLEAFWTERLNTRLSLSYDRLDNDDNALADLDLYNGFILTDEPFEDITNISLGTTTQYDITDDIGLSFVTGVNWIDQDFAFVQSPVQTARLDDLEIQVNQEVRLDGLSEDLGGLAWTTGLFFNYFYRDVNQIGASQFVFSDIGDQVNTAQAIFGEGTLPLTDTLDATLGLRVQRDKRTVDHTVTNFTSDFVHRMDDAEVFLGWNGRFALTYRPTETDTLFASISRGYKTGGFQSNHSTAITGTPADSPGFESTSSLAYEIGYRGFFLDNRLSFDASVYYIDTTDEQVLGIDVATFQSAFFNVDARSMGFELASRLQLDEHWQIGAGVAYTDATLAEELDLGFLGVAEEDSRLTNVPRWSYNGFVRYGFDLPMLGDDMSGFIRTDVVGQTRRFFELGNSFVGDAFVTVDLRAGIETDRFSISTFATNVTDERYLATGFFGRVLPADERQIGLTASVYF